MTQPVELAQVWRGDVLEAVHLGHAVICRPDGEIVAAWGDPDVVVLPRSSMKMIQALPIVESGAELDDERLALACASHVGARMHVERVRGWLAELGLGDDDLRCGPHPPSEPGEQARLIRAGDSPAQVHNNCSGKHAGFLMLEQRVGGGPEYVEPGHPVQRAVLEAFEDLTGAPSAGHAIDGCSAPNFATGLHRLATAMARFAAARGDAGATRERAMARLRAAMVTRPELVAGEGRACTELMRAMDGAAVKTGAEGVYVAILPEQRLGIALKVVDGATRASEAAIAALLVRLGAIEAAHPLAQRLMRAPIVNWRGIPTGEVRSVGGLS